jgi:hypothetical protein
MSAQKTTPLDTNNETRPRAEIEQRLARVAEGGPAAIEERLAELDREWTTNRVLSVTIGILILIGTLLAILVDPWFVVIPAIGGLLLTQYVFTRQSLLGKLFRRIGYRDSVEINEERFALKTLRGDFKDLPTVLDIEDREAINRLEGEGGMVVEPDETKVDFREAAQRVADATHGSDEHRNE